VKLSIMLIAHLVASIRLRLLVPHRPREWCFDDSTIYSERTPDPSNRPNRDDAIRACSSVALARSSSRDTPVHQDVAGAELAGGTT
jgi:hypothetical protein